MPSPSRSIAPDAALFLVLVILCDGSLALFLTPAQALTSTFYLAFFAHIGCTLYLGMFTPRRTATWLLLIIFWAVSEITAFLGYVLPPGQIGFWLLAQLPESLAHWLFDSGVGDIFQSHSASLLLLLLLLGLDLLAMHLARWRERPFWQFGALLIAAVVVAVALDALLSLWFPAVAESSRETNSFPIVPAWYTLPFYALLRAVSSKLGGVILMFAALLMPMIWPWARADELRAGGARWLWLLACLMLATAWIGLGFLGSMPPSDDALLAARVLAAVYFVFFLILPFALHRLSRSASAPGR